MLAPLTSIVPSTTAAALTTLWTGLPPAGHGVMGYEMWLKEYGLIANMIYHSPSSFTADVGGLRRAGFDPATFLPAATLGLHLQQHGIQTYAYQHTSIARSGLSTMLFPGAKVMPFRTLSDLWVTLDHQIEREVRERSYVYIYYGDLDELSHRFGPGDERVEREFDAFSRQLLPFIRRCHKRARQDTLFIVAADHGHVYTPRRPEYELRLHPNLLDCLVMLPSGEARMPYVYLRSGREAEFLAYLESTWPGQFRAFRSETAARSGLFGDGPSHPRLADRIGDYVVFPQGDAYWWFGDRDNPLLGRHGGLSSTEMLVPFFAFVL